MRLNYTALRVIRERSGLSSSQLAVEAQVSTSLISHIEAGRKDASPAVVKRLAAALKVPVVAILRDEADAA